MPPHRRHRRAFAPMLAVPAVAVVKDHVHARGIFRQIVNAKELHDRGTFAAPAAWIETANAEELSRLAAGARLPNGAPNHGRKAVEVWHAKLFLP